MLCTFCTHAFTQSIYRYYLEVKAKTMRKGVNFSTNVLSLIHQVQKSHQNFCSCHDILRIYSLVKWQVLSLLSGPSNSLVLGFGLKRRPDRMCDTVFKVGSYCNQSLHMYNFGAQTICKPHYNLAPNCIREGILWYKWKKKVASQRLQQDPTFNIQPLIIITSDS